MLTAGKYRKLRPEDRQALEDRYNSLKIETQQAITESEGRGIYGVEITTMPHLVTDSSAIGSEAKKLEKLIEIDASLEAKGSLRQRLYLRMRQIQDELSKVMPTIEENNCTMKSSGAAIFERAVLKSMQFMQRYVFLCEEWKQIKNRLDPDDPMADNIYSIAGKGGGRREFSVVI